MSECEFTYNFVDFSSHTDYSGISSCVGCNSKGGVFVPISNCVHSAVICNFFMIELKLTEMQLCLYCHSFLKKVDVFKKNLELNLQLSNKNMDTSLQQIRFYDLGFSKMKFASSDVNDISKPNIEISGVGNDESSDTCDQEEFDETLVMDENILIREETTKVSRIPNPDTSIKMKQKLNRKTNVNKKTRKKSIIKKMLNKTSKKKTKKTIFHANKIEIELVKVEDIGTKIEDEKRKKRTSKGSKLFNKERDRNRPNKEKRYPPTKIYEGVYEIILTMEELMKERAEARLKESYLKLPYKCETCIVAFDFEENLFNHTNMKHSPKPGGLTCEVCNTVLKNPEMYQKHCNNHMRRYKCEPCGRINCALRTIVDHYNREHGTIGEEHKCNQCDFTTRSWREIFHHRENMHKEKISCGQCDSQFVNKAMLRSHMLRVHKRSTREYPCEQCDKVFRIKSSLSSHIVNKHRNLGRVSRCEQCDKYFASDYSLQVHLKSHSAHLSKDQWKLICDYCGERFLQKSRIREHIEFVHLKSQEHKCELCGKTCRSQMMVKRHIKQVHERYRPPRNKICQYCGKGFSYTKTLKTHIRTHTGDRPLKCQYCPADFAHNAALYNHKKLVHGIKKKTETQTAGFQGPVS